MSALIDFRERNGFHIELSSPIENVKVDVQIAHRIFEGVIFDESRRLILPRINAGDDGGLLFRRITTVFIAEIGVMNDPTDCWLLSFHCELLLIEF